MELRINRVRINRTRPVLVMGTLDESGINEASFHGQGKFPLCWQI